jgi:amino acid adenylation domain-containing protein
MMSKQTTIGNNLAEAFYRHSVATPERPALWVDDCEYSYGEIAARACQIVHWLAEHFPGEKVHVGILASRHLEAYVGLLAALWGGHLYVPLSPKEPISYLRSIIANAELKCLVADPSCRSLLNEGLLQGLPVEVLSLDKPAGEATSKGVSPGQELTVPTQVAPDDLAYIMYTSGSTGAPKGVAPTVANVRHFLHATQSRYRLIPDDRISQLNNLHWDPSVFDLFSAWEVGASVQVVPENQTIFPTRFIQERQLTVWYSIPSQITMLERSGLLKPGALPSLRLSLFVGEPLTRAMAEAWQRAAPNSIVENVYGPTETTVVCTGQPYSKESECVTPERDYIALGTPYEGMHLDIIDPETRAFVPSGNVGEIVISGPQTTPGYWQDPEKTSKSFVFLEHPEVGVQRWYLTGDHGYRTAANQFHFLGRLDNQVQLLGKRVELEEIEAHLRKVANSTEVAAVAWPIVDGSAQHIYGFVGSVMVDEGEIKASLRQRLPSHMVPKRIISQKRLPRNRNGKIDRKQLLRTLSHDK